MFRGACPCIEKIVWQKLTSYELDVAGHEFAQETMFTVMGQSVAVADPRIYGLQWTTVGVGIHSF